MGKILARYVHEKPIPGKLFLFDNGVEAFGNTLDEQVKNAGEYARTGLDGLIHYNKVIQWGCVFTLGLIWGDSDTKVIDLYGYKGVEKNSTDSWKNANLDVTMWVIREFLQAKGSSYLSSLGGMASCETSLIILGKEAVHRRRTESLEQYLGSHAYLMEMEPFNSYQFLKI